MLAPPRSRGRHLRRCRAGALSPATLPAAPAHLRVCQARADLGELGAQLVDLAVVGLTEVIDSLLAVCTFAVDVAAGGVALGGDGGQVAAQLGGRLPVAHNAVVIISQARGDSPADSLRIARLFDDFGVTVVTVPYDESLRSGQIRFDALSVRSQRAWIAAAAAVARGFGGTA